MRLKDSLRGRFDPAKTDPVRAGVRLGVATAALVGASGLLPRPWRALPAALAASMATAGLTLHVQRTREVVLQEQRDLWGLMGAMIDGRPWPPPGGWALGANALTWLLLHVDRDRDCSIVELGPGTSSVVLSRCLPRASMWGVEHDERFVPMVERALEVHGANRYRLLHAPLRPTGTGRLWYDPAVIESLPDTIDILIVDGPPNLGGDGARELAMPELGGRLRKGALVLVDDTHRTDERRMVTEWLAHNPSLQVRHDGENFIVLDVVDDLHTPSGP